MAASAVCVVVVVALTLYNAVYPVGELIGVPRASPPYVQPGGTTTIEWGTFVKSRDCWGRILRHLEDGSRVTLAPSASTMAPGVYEEFSSTLTVPPYLPAGTWSYQVSIEYRCFPWTWHTEKLPPVEIVVLP